MKHRVHPQVKESLNGFWDRQKQRVEERKLMREKYARGEKKVFSSRPHGQGIWLEVTTRDGAVYHGVIDNDLLPLDPPRAPFTIEAPGRRPRLFQPQDLKRVVVLGVIGARPYEKRRAS
jgi:hypothetical protein